MLLDIIFKTLHLPHIAFMLIRMYWMGVRSKRSSHYYWIGWVTFVFYRSFIVSALLPQSPSLCMIILADMLFCNFFSREGYYHWPRCFLWYCHLFSTRMLGHILLFWSTNLYAVFTEEHFRGAPPAFRSQIHFLPCKIFIYICTDWLSNLLVFNSEYFYFIVRWFSLTCFDDHCFSCSFRWESVR